MSKNTIFITGGTGKISTSLTRFFLEKGDHVVLTGRSSKKIQLLKDKFYEFRDKLDCIIVDHHSEESYITIEKYLKQISLINYYGLPEFFRLGFDFHDKLKWRILRINKSSQEVKFCKMRIPIEKKIFLNKTKIFLNKILFILSGKIKTNYVIDQGGNFWDPIKSTQYFDYRKIVLVTRDPRSIFSSMKTRKSLSYPGHDIKIFCEWYKNIMKNYYCTYIL